MKVLEIDLQYYYYPEGISCIEDFIAYANEHYNTFIELTRLENDNCVYPYCIKEETKKFYLNVAKIDMVCEAEATIISRADYDSRLENLVKTKCTCCVNYEEDSVPDNLGGHRDKLCLDGNCWFYEKKK